MSYRKEDHIPDHLHIRKCIWCGDFFQQMDWWQNICPDCQFEQDENNEKEEEKP